MENNGKGLLILILPIAFIITVLIQLGPYILVAMAFSLAWRVWQEYQWRQLSIAIGPDFRQLIERNEGKVTVTDLALQTGLTGKTARWFLSRKAEEFGAQAFAHEKYGIVYYFLTSNTFGRIFEGSNPEFAIPELPPEKVSYIAAAPQPKSLPKSKPPASKPKSAELSTSKVEKSPTKHSDKPKAKSRKNKPSSSQSKKSKPSSLIDGVAMFLEEEEQGLSSEEVDLSSLEPLIQADLAKRLDVHPSTLIKRRRDEGTFSQWSRSKDPDNVPWEYDAQSKYFIPKI